jgi:hypothetical protein
MGFKLGLPLRLDTAVQFGPNVQTAIIAGLALRYGVSFGDAGLR